MWGDGRRYDAPVGGMMKMVLVGVGALALVAGCGGDDETDSETSLCSAEGDGHGNVFVDDVAEAVACDFGADDTVFISVFSNDSFVEWLEKDDGGTFDGWEGHTEDCEELGGHFEQVRTKVFDTVLPGSMECAVDGDVLNDR